MQTTKIIQYDPKLFREPTEEDYGVHAEEPVEGPRYFCPHCGGWICHTPDFKLCMNGHGCTFPTLEFVCVRCHKTFQN